MTDRIRSRAYRASGAAGFTVVELAVVAAMIAILDRDGRAGGAVLARRQKELELRYPLRMMREAIDKYKQLSDPGLIPLKIGGEGYRRTSRRSSKGVTLVGQIDKKQKFLRRIPIDPMTDKAEWGMRSYQDEPDTLSWGGQNVYDVYSLSEARAPRRDVLQGLVMIDGRLDPGIGDRRVERLHPPRAARRHDDHRHPGGDRACRRCGTLPSARARRRCARTSSRFAASSTSTRATRATTRRTSQMLVKDGYIRKIPFDPMTKSAETGS